MRIIVLKHGFIPKSVFGLHTSSMRGEATRYAPLGRLLSAPLAKVHDSRHATLKRRFDVGKALRQQRIPKESRAPRLQNRLGHGDRTNSSNLSITKEFLVAYQPLKTLSHPKPTDHPLDVTGPMAQPLAH